MLTVSTGIDFPNAAQAIQIRRRLDEPKRFTTETVYAITDPHIHQAKPRHLAAWIRGHWAIENKIHWVRDVTSTKTAHRSAPAPGNTSWPPCATPLSAPYASTASPTSPPPTDTTLATAPARSPCSESPDDFAGALAWK
jgi:hypothetical protein